MISTNGTHRHQTLPPRNLISRQRATTLPTPSLFRNILLVPFRDLIVRHGLEIHYQLLPRVLTLNGITPGAVFGGHNSRATQRNLFLGPIGVPGLIGPAALVSAGALPLAFLVYLVAELLGAEGARPFVTSAELQRVLQVHGARVRVEVAGVDDRDAGYDPFVAIGAAQDVARGARGAVLRPLGALPGRVAVAAVFSQARLVIRVRAGRGEEVVLAGASADELLAAAGDELQPGLEQGRGHGAVEGPVGQVALLTQSVQVRAVGRRQRVRARTVHAVRGVGVMLNGFSVQEMGGGIDDKTACETTTIRQHREQLRVIVWHAKASDVRLGAATYRTCVWGEGHLQVDWLKTRKLDSLVKWTIAGFQKRYYFCCLRP